MGQYAPGRRGGGVGRTEYLNDPEAPKANSIVPAANAFVRDDDGAVLMIERSDNRLWAMPGGMQDIGETIAAAAERETLEETGYRVRVVGLIGVYSDPGNVIAYDDGEIKQQFALCFRAQLLGGALATSEESPSVRWVRPDELDAIPIHPSVRLRIDHGLAELACPYIG
jgi:8-oxo-dGTP pyrophosphatase MutT (NUDIX family)